MLECKPIEDKDEQEKDCSICTIEFIPNAMAYSAYDSGVFLGMAQFSLAPDGGHIINVASAAGTDDAEARFVLGRAVMNFVDLCGEKNIWCDDADDSIGKMLGFKKNPDGRYFMDMTGFFDAPCKHCGEHKQL